jgi:hypothetical protein
MRSLQNIHSNFVIKELAILESKFGIVHYRDVGMLLQVRSACKRIRYDVGFF